MIAMGFDWKLSVANSINSHIFLSAIILPVVLDSHYIMNQAAQVFYSYQVFRLVETIINKENVFVGLFFLLHSEGVIDWYVKRHNPTSYFAKTKKKYFKIIRNSNARERSGRQD